MRDVYGVDMDQAVLIMTTVVAFAAAVAAILRDLRKPGFERSQAERVQAAALAEAREHVAIVERHGRQLVDAVEWFRQTEQRRLAADCEHQHRALIAGDFDLAVYGRFPPVALEEVSGGEPSEVDVAADYRARMAAQREPVPAEYDWLTLIVEAS